MCFSEYHKDTNQLHVVLEHGDTDMSTFFQRHAKDRSMTSEVIRFYWTQMLNAVGVLHREGKHCVSNGLNQKGKVLQCECGASRTMVRMLHDQSRGPWFESFCCRFKVWAILFIPRCLGSLSYLATDNGGYM